MKDWHANFANYATGTAFQMSLSRNHVALLSAIDDGTYRNFSTTAGRSNFYGIYHGLERRGLAEHNAAARLIKMADTHIKLRWVYRLTPAGKHVLELCRLAGIVPMSAAPAALPAEVANDQG